MKSLMKLLLLFVGVMFTVASCQMNAVEPMPNGADDLMATSIDGGGGVVNIEATCGLWYTYESTSPKTYIRFDEFGTPEHVTIGIWRTPTLNIINLNGGLLEDVLTARRVYRLPNGTIGHVAEEVIAQVQARWLSISFYPEFRIRNSNGQWSGWNIQSRVFDYVWPWDGVNHIKDNPAYVGGTFEFHLRVGGASGDCDVQTFAILGSASGGRIKPPKEIGDCDESHPDWPNCEIPL